MIPSTTKNPKGVPSTQKLWPWPSHKKIAFPPQVSTFDPDPTESDYDSDSDCDLDPKICCKNCKSSIQGDIYFEPELPSPIYGPEFLQTCPSPWLHHGYCPPCIELIRHIGFRVWWRKCDTQSRQTLWSIPWSVLGGWARGAYCCLCGERKPIY